MMNAENAAEDEMAEYRRVCFLSSARYTCPLNVTEEKKFHALSALGRIIVVGFSPDWKPRRFTHHAELFLLPRLPLASLRYVSYFTIVPWLALWLTLTRDVQIIVSQSPYEGYAAAQAKKIARLMRKQVALIVESHTDFEESLFLHRRVLWPNIYRRLMRWTARVAFSEADLLRCVSTMTHEQLAQWSPGKPIVNFPAWTDLDAFYEAGNQESERDENRVLYAGKLIPRKGIHVLIEAFAKARKTVPDAYLDIMGKEANSDYAEQLRARVAELNLASKVRFKDAVPQQELADHIARSQVLVVPSLSEGMGRVIIEAMAARTPVIASRTGGIPDLIEDGQTGFLVPPSDPDALAEQLVECLSKPREMEMISDRAHEFAMEFFSAKGFVENYQQSFDMAQQEMEKPIT